MVELVVGSIGLFSIGRGVWLAMRNATNAPWWLAVGAGFALALATTVSATPNPAMLFLAATTGISAGVVLFIATRLGHEHQASLEDADDAQISRFLGEARAHRFTLRLRSRRGARLTWPYDHKGRQP